MRPGEEIGIPCQVKKGPFSEERLISFDTVDGPITGFVSETDLRQIEGQKWLVRAVFLKQEGDVVTVRVRGSFFTTNGLAKIRREMAMAA